MIICIKRKAIIYFILRNALHPLNVKRKIEEKKQALQKMKTVVFSGTNKSTIANIAPIAAEKRSPTAERRIFVNTDAICKLNKSTVKLIKKYISIYTVGILSHPFFLNNSIIIYLNKRSNPVDKIKKGYYI